MTQDIEQLAQQLEQHPDYRVLRRLVPGRVFNTPAPGQKLSKVKADMERDFWMSATDAKRYGLIDTVLAAKQ